jgi:dihydrofolate reductase
MGRVLLDLAVSLDGFICGPNGEDHGLNNWFFDGNAVNGQVVAESTATTGAIIMGRRAYAIGEQYGGYEDSPYQAANFVLTHQAPAQPAKGAENFVFVTDGIASALRQAQAAAGAKTIAIGGGANVAQQYLAAGLVDEIQLHVIPILLHNGIRLFATGSAPVQLELLRVIEAPGATHLKYRVVR